MKHMQNIFRRPLCRTLCHLWHDTRGTSAIEWAFIAMLISVAIIAAVMALGEEVNILYTHVDDEVGRAMK